MIIKEISLSYHSNIKQNHFFRSLLWFYKGRFTYALVLRIYRYIFNMRVASRKCWSSGLRIYINELLPFEGSRLLHFGIRMIFWIILVRIAGWLGKNSRMICLHDTFHCRFEKEFIWLSGSRQKHVRFTYSVGEP